MYKIHASKESNDLVTVDYNLMCIMKGIKPINKAGIKRTFNTKQADRVSTNYPTSYHVAQLFGLDKLPDEGISSKLSTYQYIIMMYGKKYADNY